MKDRTSLILVITALLISLSVSVHIGYKRIQLEKSNNSVEIVLDNNDVERLSVLIKMPAKEILTRFRDAGVVSVALSEGLAGTFDQDLMQGVDPKKLNLYIPSKGISQTKASVIRSSGLIMIPRIRNIFNASPAVISKKLKDISKDRIVIFAEEEVLGYPNYLRETAISIRSNNLKYGYIEFGKQLGDNTLSSYLGGSIVKVHSIPPDEMEKLTKIEMIKRYGRAARERGIRVLYVHLLQYPDHAKDLLGTNIAFIQAIKKEILSNGFIIGKATSPKKIQVSRIQKALLALGVAGGAALLIGSFMQLNITYVVMLILFIPLIMSSKLLALMAAVIFPAYAVISQFPENNKGPSISGGRISKAAAAVTGVAGVSAVGAAIISSLLADKLNIMGIDAFSGVKVAFILPIVIVAAYFFLRDENGRFVIKDSVRKFKGLFDLNITPLHLTLLMFAALAGALLIIRSGNFGVPVPAFERMAREILENVFAIRPRTKEFLIGYPAIFIAAIYQLMGGRKWLWMFLAIGSLAPISMINSFCHIHTPLAITITRSCYGIILGAALGAILYFSFIIAGRIYRNIIK